MDEEKSTLAGKPVGEQETVEALIKRAQAGDPEAKRTIIETSESLVDLIRTFWKAIVEVGDSLIEVLGPAMLEMEKHHANEGKAEPDAPTKDKPATLTPDHLMDFAYLTPEELNQTSHPPRWMHSPEGTVPRWKESEKPDEKK